jgi:two-component system, OmpR family, sensor histidine kinase TctE
MKPWRSSIRRQLLGWLLIPILSLWVVGSIITYVLAIDFANNAYDNALLDSARAVASRLVFREDSVSVDMPPAAQSILKFNEKDSFFYQVLDQHGSLLSGDDSIPQPVLSSLSKEPAFRDGLISHHEVRMVQFQVPIPDRPNNQFVVIQVAETIQGIDELTDKVLLGVVLPQLLLIILAGLAVWFGVTRGLRPLQELQRAVAARSPSDLRELPAESAPKEVRPLVLAINELLVRLREDREAQKRFVANAAHQLRTPLAGLKTQSELAARSQDPDDLRHSLTKIRTSADRATRLVQQLLSLARVEPAAMTPRVHKPVNINGIARDVTSELVPQALAKKIDLGFEGFEQPCLILGDAENLYEMMVNLVENAVLYTQEGGKVTVRLENPQQPRLIVEDNGPGIPENEREHVFERFYRTLGTSVHGSGLGLAIVQEIAELHDAVVRFADGPEGNGTSAVVQFPKSESDMQLHGLQSRSAEPPFARI